MKSSVLIVVLALLVGASLFGIFKSLELSKRNADLRASMDLLKGKLSQTEFSLKEARSFIGEVSLKNARLEGEVSSLNKKLSKKEKEILEQGEQISLLIQRFKETAEVNLTLLDQHNSLSSQMVRLELENAEMKKRLSSVDELKKAIKELKARRSLVQQEKRLIQKKGAVREALVKKAPAIKKKIFFGPPKSSDDLTSGNEGYVVRQGKSTYEGLVEIRVIPTQDEPF
jgi:chromosome segregation ATPase